ncbi:MAG TPA: extracellular solute-binding protein [Xanthobacteraceae bacterium]|nr:extracellular solute-binding protein [Xanthobacteraceae bacterium]
MRVQWSLIVTLVATAFLCSGAARAAPWEDLLQKLYPAAKQEGEVIFNTEREEEVGGKEGVAQFQKRYPGIKVTFNGLAGAVLPSRMVLEAKTGHVTIDAFRSDPSRAAPMVEKDLLLKIDPAEITEQPVQTFFDDRFFKLGDHITNFAYNSAFVPAAARPKTYEDLLNPRWQRRLILDARGGEIAHLLSDKVWDEAKFWDFVNKLKAQKPIWSTRNTEAMVKLSSGEGYVGTGSYAAIEELKRQGAPVDFLFLSPSLAQARGGAILRAAAHPNAAKLFLGWLLSPEGLKARDHYAVGTITPGTTLYDRVQAAGATIIYEKSIDQILARDDVANKITDTWGVLSTRKD